MYLAQDNDVVPTFTPDRSDQPFDKAILPGRGWCGRLVPDAHGTQSAADDGAVDPIAVSNHVTGSPVPRRGLGYLTCNPLCCRVGCDVDPREVPTIEPHDDEGIKQVEANGRDNKQVHGGNVWSMITQEGSPSLAGWPPSFNHVLRDARLRDTSPAQQPRPQCCTCQSTQHNRSAIPDGNKRQRIVRAVERITDR